MPLSPYGGFRLSGKHGNNVFAYDERKRTDPDPKLRVPSLKEISSIDDIELDDQPVFAELDDAGNVVTYT